jgi:hypothetical protein
MKNIHLIPTDKPSRLHLESNGLKLSRLQYTLVTQHIYITNDEDINENDYIITKDGRLVQVSYLLSKDLDGSSKVILTTDQDLIKDGVQAIDDEFLEWFVKNPSCESVETIYGLFNPMGRQVDPNNLGQNHSRCIWKHKIIIPKEEPKQRLEKYSERFDNKDNEVVQGVFSSENWGKRLVEEVKCTGQCWKFIESDYEETCLSGCEKIEYKIIIPQEEPIQETLEEVAENYKINIIKSGRSHRVEYTQQIKLDFIEGAKWQQERSYSEEEMIAFGEFIFKHSLLTHTRGVKSLFEQYKKK